jgi:hypothetical protein
MKPHVADTLKSFGCEATVEEFRAVLAETKAELFPGWSDEALIVTRDEAAVFCQAVKKKLGAPADQTVHPDGAYRSQEGEEAEGDAGVEQGLMVEGMDAQPYWPCQKMPAFVSKGFSRIPDDRRQGCRQNSPKMGSRGGIRSKSYSRHRDGTSCQPSSTDIGLAPM